MANFILTNTFDTLREECSSIASIPLSHTVPDTVPPTFAPTPLQMTVKHNQWIDSVPCPRLRDNLILASTASTSYHQIPIPASNSTHALDEDALCTDICGGIYDGLDDCATRGLLLWGDPWVVSNWEVTQGFVGKWGWLLKGCTEMVEASNAWRGSRGEEGLGFVVGEVN
jgi:hypothetical protein